MGHCHPTQQNQRLGQWVQEKEKKINGRHPLHITRFIYEHMRDRDFQKYLSLVGVILQKCKARVNKIPVNPQLIRPGKT